MEKNNKKVKILFGSYITNDTENFIYLNDILVRDSFLNSISKSLDIKMIKGDLIQSTKKSVEINADVLIVEEGVTDIQRVIFRDVNTLVFLGDKIFPSIIAFKNMGPKTVMFMNSNFLKGSMFLEKGCTYIIENFENFNDKDNFIKQLKSNNKKIKQLKYNIIKSNDCFLINFLIENKTLNYENLLECFEFDISQEAKLIISDALNNSSEHSKEKYLESLNRQEELDLGIESYTISDFKKHFSCSIKKNEIIVSKYQGDSESAIFPSNVDGVSNYSLKNISKNSTLRKIYFEEGVKSITLHDCNVNPFSDVNKLTEIYLPKSLEYIDFNFFATLNKNINVYASNDESSNIYLTNNLIIQNNSIVYVNNKQTISNTIIPENINCIGSFAFEGCSLLETIVIPNNVNIVEKFAFFNCLKLSKVDFNNKSTTISETSFYGCSKLKEANLDNKIYFLNEKYSTYEFSKIFNYKINAEKISIDKYLLSEKSIKFPNSINGVSNYLLKDFKKNKSVKKIYFEEGVEGIFIENFSRFTLSSLSALEEIHFPKSLKYIDPYIFHSLNRSNVKIFSSNTNINYLSVVDDFVIFDCKVVYMNPSIRFKNEIIIPEGTKFFNITIPNFEKITSFIFPKSIEVIETCLFDGCSALEKIIVNEGNENYCTIDNVLYDKTIANLLKVPPLYKLSTFNIPNTVSDIQSLAFNNCSNIDSITISNNVKTLTTSVFSGCSSLKFINITNNITTIGSNCFKNCTSLEKIFIPNTVMSISDTSFLNCTKITIYTSHLEKPFRWNLNEKIEILFGKNSI